MLHADLDVYLVCDNGELFQECIGCMDILEALHIVQNSEWFPIGEYVLIRNYDEEVFRFTKTNFSAV